MTLGDADQLGQFGHLNLWILGNLHGNMTVVAQECPTHIANIPEVEMRYFISCIIFPMTTLEMISTNLLSVPVLAFVLGVLACRFKTNLKVSEGAFEAISFVLLLGIGLKGGHALKSSSVTTALPPVLSTLAIGIIIPALVFLVLKLVKGLTTSDRGAIAAHYGSTSLVTFTAALVFLDASQIKYEGIVTTLLVMMEIPGILVGILLARGGWAALKNKTLVHEIFFGKTVLLLLGGVLIGVLTSEESYAKVSPLFSDAQPGLLTLFLLTLGVKAGASLPEFKKLGVPLAFAGVAVPVFAGLLGSALGTLAGLSVGGATALAVLAASASYIAAPAAVGIALPDAKQGLPITMSLGLTFPFNLAIGLPLYLWFAELFAGWLH